MVHTHNTETVDTIIKYYYYCIRMYIIIIIMLYADRTMVIAEEILLKF